MGLVRYEVLQLTPEERPDSNKLDIANREILSSNLPEDLKSWCRQVLAAPR